MKLKKAFYQVSEVAHHLGISNEYVYRLIQDGRLEANCLGPRVTRVTKESLDQLKAESRIDPNSFN